MTVTEFVKGRYPVQTLSSSLSLIFHYRVKGSAKVVAISSCGNIMDEYSREGRLWEVPRDQESYLNEISAVLRTEERVSLSEKRVCAHVGPCVCVCVCVQLCVPALKEH